MMKDSAGGRGSAEQLSASRRCRRRVIRWDQPKSKRTPTVNLSAFCPALDLEGTLFTILSFLPLHKIFELRLVCKAWNTLLHSPAFLSAWSRAPHEGWLVMVRKLPKGHPFVRELIAHDPATDRWMSLQPLLDSCPSPALDILGGSHLRNVVNPVFNPDQESSGLSQFGVAAGVSGFVCFLTSPTAPHVQDCDDVNYAYDRKIFSLVVVNLLTGSHHNLPQYPRHSNELASWHDFSHSTLLVSMQPLPNNSYRVFLQPQRGYLPGPIQIYDSSTGRWKVGRPCDSPSDAKIGSAADLDRADRLQFLHDSHAVFAYSADLDEWSLVLAQFPRSPDGPGSLSYKNRYTLFRYRGRVFLVFLQLKVGSVFSIWKLCMHPSSPFIAGGRIPVVADWVQVTRTPRHLWSSRWSFEGSVTGMEVKVISCGSLICMTAVLNTDSNYGGTYLPPLVYDLERDAWHHLPSYKGGNDFLAACSLQPSFIATA